MANRIEMHFVICLLILGFAGCSKNKAITEKSEDIDISVPVPVIPDSKPNSETPVTYSKTYDLGTGSGNLTINGSSLTLEGNVLIKIKGGNYKAIDIKNIQSVSGSVTIQNDGLVEMNSGQMRLENLNNVKISGNGTSGIEKGFVFKDNVYRPIEVDGTLDNFTLQYASFKNIGDNVFTYKYDKVYDGSRSSYSENLKFLNIDCENTGQFISGSGSVENGLIKGYIKNIEIAYITFKNSADVGSIVWLGNVENYDVHHNVVNNINTTNNNHNGIFLLNGNGRFHNNKISNHQGNAIRAFSFTVGSTPKDVLIYNNIVVNSRKYSAFEVQSFSNTIVAGKTTFVNAIVFNNTCGNLNLSKDWQGNLVDIYSLQGGKCTVYNNLAFNLPAPYVIAGQVADLVPTAYNNFYYNSSKDAGIIDEIDFKLSYSSPAKSKGIVSSIADKDFYGNPRNSTPSVGAVE
jgi:hypothetical protein